MDDGRPISRRALLAAGGVLAGLGGMSVVTQAQQVNYNVDAKVDGSTSGIGLSVKWKEWYNGTVVGSRGADEDAPGQVSIPDLKPGDSGTVAFGITPASPEEQDTEPVLARTRLYAAERLENGRNEPERAAGDTTDDVGELQEFIDVELLYDNGIQIADLPLYGTGDAEEDTFGDPNPIVSGILGDVSATQNEFDNDEGWREIDATPNDPAGGPCLQPGETLYVVLNWAFTTDTDRPVNVAQGDSVEFTIGFDPLGCSQ